MSRPASRCSAWTAPQQEAAVEANRRKITEVEADMVVAQSQLKETEGRIAQAQGAYQQAKDEYDTRAELMRRNPNAISQREVDRMRVRVETEQGQVDAAMAAREAIIAQIEFQLPAAEGERRSRAASGAGRSRQDARRRRHRRDGSAVRAATGRRRQPDAPARRHPRARTPGRRRSSPASIRSRRRC